MSVQLRPGDTFNFSTGAVRRNDPRTLPAPPVRVLDSMLSRNDLRALSLYFRNATAR